MEFNEMQVQYLTIDDLTRITSWWPKVRCYKQMLISYFFYNKKTQNKYYIYSTKRSKELTAVQTSYVPEYLSDAFS